ncbi:hypothetical protein T07_116 [Trichinella nelsoni]|uniref:Uncharacterized protein n=1 Tax=Trichinella nelsoni TaxID=6336 RepID=A0A0V0S1P1_9BILA|nr:hypothetical protein T07_116 [Trichinella nelsoni]
MHYKFWIEENIEIWKKWKSFTLVARECYCTSDVRSKLRVTGKLEVKFSFGFALRAVSYYS